MIFKSTDFVLMSSLQISVSQNSKLFFILKGKSTVDPIFVYLKESEFDGL